MGAPGYTAFCSNGHIVKDVGHHCIDDEQVYECPMCKSHTFVTIFEWPDSGYQYSDLVSLNPIRYDEVHVNNEHFSGTVRVDVYDVSKIPESEWKNTVY